MNINEKVERTVRIPISWLILAIIGMIVIVVGLIAMLIAQGKLLKVTREGLEINQNMADENWKRYEEAIKTATDFSNKYRIETSRSDYFKEKAESWEHKWNILHCVFEDGGKFFGLITVSDTDYIVIRASDTEFLLFASNVDPDSPNSLLYLHTIANAIPLSENAELIPCYPSFDTSDGTFDNLVFTFTSDDKTYELCMVEIDGEQFIALKSR